VRIRIVFIVFVLALFPQRRGPGRERQAVLQSRTDVEELVRSRRSRTQARASRRRWSGSGCGNRSGPRSGDHAGRFGWPQSSVSFEHPDAGQIRLAIGCVRRRAIHIGLAVSEFQQPCRRGLCNWIWWPFDALIWPAMLTAAPALFSESSRQEYVADPIVTEWLYAALR